MKHPTLETPISNIGSEATSVSDITPRTKNIIYLFLEYKHHIIKTLKVNIMSPLAITFVCIGALLLALFIAYFCSNKKKNRK